MSILLNNELKVKIKNYYRNEKSINLQKIKLEDLKLKLSETEQDINGFNLDFNIDIQSADCNKIIINECNFISNNRERDFDSIFYRLEDDCKFIKTEILSTKMFIRKLEFDNEYIKNFIDILDEENKKILKLKYGDCKSSVSISFIMNLSKSTVNERINKILDDILNQIKYFDEIKW